MSVLSLIPEDRKKDFQRKESIENVYSSGSRLSLLNKRKRLNPLASAMSNQSLSSKAGGDRYVTQRVLSAKTHRVKQLQNQLNDAHYHLQELSNENRMLRAMQKKQEIALSRYENSNAELPTVLNSHTEEMRIQQTKHKQLRNQYREVVQKLKERDLQLQQLKDEHQHLLELSKDRNLLEREKLQAQVSDLTAKIQQQNETISTLQRRIVLEAKNFRHQLQQEINKHKDTRHDLDLAISNADKLSTIIEMKEKMLSTAASRCAKSPIKAASVANITRPTRSAKGQDSYTNKANDDRIQAENNFSKLCETSRNLSSVLSHDEETSSSAEPRSRYIRSRTNSTSTKSTPIHARKISKGSDEIIELAKSVQDGMADLAIFDDEIDTQNSSPEDMQKKLDTMKAELLSKIKNNEEPGSRKTSALRRMSNEESIEEEIDEIGDFERPRSRGRRNSSVSFYDDRIEETTTTVANNNYKCNDEMEHPKLKRENSNAQKKPIEKYCKEIVYDIEKSNRVIEKHVKNFNNSKLESDKIVQQLQAVDKINEFVNSNGEISEQTLAELNTNFQMLTEQVLTDAIPVARKRSVSGRRNARVESRTNLFGDSQMSNRELLDDLLGKNN